MNRSESFFLYNFKTEILQKSELKVKKQSAQSKLWTCDAFFKDKLIITNKIWYEVHIRLFEQLYYFYVNLLYQGSLKYILHPVFNPRQQ